MFLFFCFYPHTHKSLQCQEKEQFYWIDLSNVSLQTTSGCAMALALHEWNPAGRQISCLSRHSLFLISWGQRYFSSKIFLERTSAVSVYMEKEFKFLVWPVARPHSVASQVVLLCNNGNIWVLPHRHRTEHRFSFMLGDSLFNSFISLSQSLG